MKWWQIAGAVVLVIGGIWLYRFATTPAPGKQFPDQGREHVSPEEVAKFKYNSNPPTSGPHLPIWVKPGIYTTPQIDGELIHSLEHGYVIISYNCTVHLQTQNSKFLPAQAGKIQTAYAHEEDGSPAATIEVPPTASGSAINESGACKTLLGQFEAVARKQKLWKLIVVPRPQLDATIALTAWGHIDIFDRFDQRRIERFINYYRDHGPEATAE